MAQELVHIGQVEEIESARGDRILRYSVEIFHKGLHEHKIISAPEEDILENKVKIQLKKWDDKWNAARQKAIQKGKMQANQAEAASRTKEAEAAFKQLENILHDTLKVNDAIDWNAIKRIDKFPDLPPQKPVKAPSKEPPPRPDESSPAFTPTFNFWDKVFKSKMQQKLEESTRKYRAAIAEWEKEKAVIENYNRHAEDEFKLATVNWERELKAWGIKRERFVKKQERFNQKIEALKAAYIKNDERAIIEYCEMVLNNSKYPESFPQSFELEYNPENKMLIIEYELPNLNKIPRVKEVKFFSSKNELKEIEISESQAAKIYDDVIYKITLRTLHEIFEADKINAIDVISFNGWVVAVNPATGKKETNCILSIQANREEFMQINLSKVDPKVCFKNLKGIASSRLSTLTPIPPILRISKEDRRFVEAYAVVGGIDQETNLAAMNWEDFEHLIRELFEKEFSANGGEVKVTRASRDGGVDAIAFDPDPLRGGKIVIQAKRYTNTVGVSAVRDLYGTVVNEGATKGILVTTADYGPDAYEFARGKPLTLLTGSNLLSLLMKHGHHAKIDLKEAKRLLAEQEIN